MAPIRPRPDDTPRGTDTKEDMARVARVHAERYRRTGLRPGALTMSDNEYARESDWAEAHEYARLAAYAAEHGQPALAPYNPDGARRRRQAEEAEARR